MRKGTKEIKGTKETKETEETNKEKAQINQLMVQIIAAVISSSVTLIVGLVTAFFAFPPFQELVRSWINPPRLEAIAIEKMPFSIFVYDGESNPDAKCCAGKGYFVYTNNSKLSPEYSLKYNLKEDQSNYGYAGIAFIFTQSQNISEYKNIEFTVTFDEGTDQVEINLEDISLLQDTYRIVGKARSEKEFVVPISNFESVDSKAIHAIGFEVDNSFAKGAYTFTVKNLRLTK